MIKLRYFFTCFLLVILLFSSSVFATDEVLQIEVETPIITEGDSNKNAESIYEDLYIYNIDSYTLHDNVYGNIFASTTKFTTDPRSDGGNIYGNLYIVSNEVVIGSDVSYSNNKDKHGNYVINSINANSVINGNVYAFTDSFIIEAGSIIRGDLYIASTNVDIHEDAIVQGNVFITGTNISLKGQIGASAYITAKNFDMNYFGYISRDLYLNSDNATLSGVIYRNAYVTTTENLITTPYFRVDQNLSVDYSSNFTFGGEVKSNASFNAEKLSFNNSDDGKCIINGNLKYGTKTETTVPDETVIGEITKTNFINMNSTNFSIENRMFSFFIILFYIIVVVLLCKSFAPKAIKTLSTLNFKNILISFAVGLASIIAIAFLFIILIVSGIGMALSLLSVVGYLFILGLALPLLFYNIANMIKWNLNLYVKLIIITAIYYLISVIPVIGTPVVFITLSIGTGRIFLGIFKKK